MNIYPYMDTHFGSGSFQSGLHRKLLPATLHFQMESTTDK